MFEILQVYVIQEEFIKENSGQGKKTKVPVSSYFHIFGEGIF